MPPPRHAPGNLKENGKRVSTRTAMAGFHIVVAELVTVTAEMEVNAVTVSPTARVPHVNG